MFEVKIFPIYGAAIGVNYWDSFMEEQDEEHDESVHILQVFLTLFGLSIIWYKPL